MQATVAHHFADAEHMLKDIQHQRNNLESNLKAVERKRVEKGFYHLLDTVPFNRFEIKPRRCITLLTITSLPYCKLRNALDPFCTNLW